MGDGVQVIAGGNKRQLIQVSWAALAEADGGRKGVADAFAAEGFLGTAALAPIVFEGFGGTAVANRTVGRAVEVTEVAEATMPRNRGRLSWCGAPPQKSPGSKPQVYWPPGREPWTSMAREVGCPCARRSRAPGMARGMPAP